MGEAMRLAVSTTVDAAEECERRQSVDRPAGKAADPRSSGREQGHGPLGGFMSHGRMDPPPDELELDGGPVGTDVEELEGQPTGAVPGFVENARPTLGG